MAEVKNTCKDNALPIFKANLPWDKLSECNILVTGATGLIGGRLVETLMTNPNKDYHVYALGRNEKRARERFHLFTDDTTFHFMQHDVTKPLDNVGIDFHYIIHLASGASPNVMASSPVDIMKANFIGTDNLLSYGMSHQMKRFLYVSSGEIYGEGKGEMFSETDSGYVNSMLSRSCYPSSKRAAETLCASYMSQYGVDVVVARPCHIYGASFTESDNRAYAQFFRNVVNGEDIVLKSPGLQYRSWLYVEDCVSALLYILLKGECGEAYNVADEDSCLSIRELAETIAELGGKQVVFAEPADSEIKGGSKITRAVFNTNKLRGLGWKPNYAYRSALECVMQK